MPEDFLSGRVTLHRGDCLEILREIAENSVDSVVTDPPYHLTSIVKRFGANAAAPASGNAAYTRASAGFMGQKWDGGDIAFRPETWVEVLRVMKPGAHLAAFAAPKNFDLMFTAIREAGFEVRDSIFDLLSLSELDLRFIDSLTPDQAEALARLIDHREAFSALAWIFGSGFPKSHDVSKAIDMALGATRAKVRIDAVEVRNPKATGRGRDGMDGATRPWIEAALACGFHEAVSDQAVSDQAVQWAGWGTALKPAIEPICLARKPLAEPSVAANVLKHGTGALHIDACRVGAAGGRAGAGAGGVVFGDGLNGKFGEPVPGLGRWPANVVHDGSEEVMAPFPDSESSRSEITSKPGAVYGNGAGLPSHTSTYGFDDSGSAARFFYSAKANRDDRIGSRHPTVKPVGLMRWLVRLITPPGGMMLDPFAGTGTTGEAAWREGFSATLIERESNYCDDIARRLALCLEGREIRKSEAAKARHNEAPRDLGPLFGGGEGVGEAILDAIALTPDPSPARERGE